jgi:hypothetical protein
LYRYKTSFGWATFDHEPFYVGKGTNNERSKTHLWQALSTKFRSRKTNKIRKIVREGLTVIVKHARSRCSEAESLAMEYELIEVIGRLDYNEGPLTNGTDGGDGACGRILSEESRAKLRAARVGFRHTEETKALMRMRRHTEEVKQKMCEDRKAKGFKHSDEAKEKMRQAALGRVRSLESRAKQSAAKRAANALKAPKQPRVKIGLKNSPETRERKRLAALGRVNSAEARAKMAEAKRNAPMRECPHCNKVGRGGIMLRWHFDNCKINPS